ncbi:hypothetical protein BMBphi_gp037 [Bacillus phage vB_BthS_BMBphi]|nr:hypothetical protein BMBphi_gp037 [Bacillus phage vB_BthS_BMBphi]
MAKKGQAFDEVKVVPQEVFIQKLADKFKSQMDSFFRKNLGDDPIMKEWHRSFYLMMEKGTEYPPVKQWLRPSMVGADEQQIWLQLHGYKSDQQLSEDPQDEVHTRWQAIGTQIGDMWQRQILAAEHWTKKGKAQVDFRFERKTVETYPNDGGFSPVKEKFPYFEEFAREYHEIDGVPVWGTCDGILNYMEYSEEAGEHLPSTRIGFEVKSKQTTNASTGTYKMKTYEEKHRQQILTYALMYDLDYYFILYQNCSKKGWTQDEETKTKYPDVRVFGIYITEEDKAKHRDYLHSLWALQTAEDKPPLNPLKWQFNSHKISAIVNMDNTEWDVLVREVNRIDKSKEYTTFEKKCAWQCLEEVRQARETMKK